jgi:hypothetical protein
LCRQFDTCNANPAVIVDLLVTVDAAAWRNSDTLNRTLGKCVKRNVNYWQPNGGTSGSHGAMNTGDPNIQRLDEQYQRPESHDKINDGTMAEVNDLIQKAVDVASTEEPLVGLWNAVIGDWRGLFEFAATVDATWQEADPQRLKKDSKKRTGVWFKEGAEFRWQYKDDVKELGSQRTWVAARPLGKTVKGKILPEGRGFYEMTKR